jgi:four helix bundle protein
MEENIQTKTFAFAIDIVELSKILMNDRKEFVMSKQLLKSGTSIGANVREAQNAESKPDFIHKMGIAQKEADETIYWLDLLKATSFIDETEHNRTTEKAISILKIIRTIIIRSKSNKALN